MLWEKICYKRDCRRKYRWITSDNVNMIDTMDEPKDYLQVFDLSEENGKQKIVHSQEQPEYMKEYLFETGTPFFVKRFCHRRYDTFNNAI